MGCQAMKQVDVGFFAVYPSSERPAWTIYSKDTEYILRIYGIYSKSVAYFIFYASTLSLEPSLEQEDYLQVLYFSLSLPVSAVAL